MQKSIGKKSHNFVLKIKALKSNYLLKKLSKCFVTIKSKINKGDINEVLGSTISRLKRENICTYQNIPQIQR